MGIVTFDGPVKHRYVTYALIPMCLAAQSRSTQGHAVLNASGFVEAMDEFRVAAESKPHEWTHTGWSVVKNAVKSNILQCFSKMPRKWSIRSSK